MQKKSFLEYAVPITAILIAVVAAFFSIYGIAKVFAGAAMFVAIMASVLEVGKLVGVSYVYIFWSEIGWARKIYLTVGIVILMIITSAGIYGFLSNAYQSTANQIEIVKEKTDNINNKKIKFIGEISNIQKRIQSKETRKKLLDDQRNKQELRQDNNKSSIRKEAAKQIVNSDAEIVKLDKQIDSLTAISYNLNDSIAACETQITKFNTDLNIKHDVGPLKYISQLLNVEMNRVVNWLILLFICVFDPLAMSLVIAANHLSSRKKNTMHIATTEKIAPQLKSNDLSHNNNIIEQTVTTNIDTVKSTEIIEIPEQNIVVSDAVTRAIENSIPEIISGTQETEQQTDSIATEINTIHEPEQQQQHFNNPRTVHDGGIHFNH